MSIQITFLGTGTSMGVPVIGCTCPVCTSKDPRNNRTRPSLYVRYNGKAFLIDTAPELRLQAITNGIEQVDALLFTHLHADHIFGFDDIRRFNQLQRQALPVYAAAETLNGLKSLFGYAFDRTPSNWNIPQVISHTVSGPFELFGLTVYPITVMHGSSKVTAYRFADVAYVTDCNYIDEEGMASLMGLDILVLDALRFEPHPKHFSLDEALGVVRQLRPRRTYFTHLSHAFDHAQVEAQLPNNVFLAYDGLSLESEF